MRRTLLGLALVALVGQACIVLTDFDFHEVTAGSGGGAQGGQGGQGGACSPCGSECVALEDNPAHCGACDRDCQGGDCIDGDCQPVLLHEGGSGEQYKHVAVFGGTVCWTVANPMLLRAVRTDGTDPADVGSFPQEPDFVAMAGDTAAVTSFVGNWLQVVHVPTARIIDQATEISAVVDVAMEGDVVVWHRYNEAGIVRRGTVGSLPGTDLAVDQYRGFGITIDGGYTYWSTFGDGQSIPGTIGGAGTPTTRVVLAANEFKPSGIDVDATHVYWIDGRARIRRVTRQTPYTIDELYGGYPMASDGEKGFSQLVRVDETHVYAIIAPGDNPAEMGVLRVDKTTGDARYVVANTHIHGLTDDDATLYYTTPRVLDPPTPARLWKLAK